MTLRTTQDVLVALATWDALSHDQAGYTVEELLCEFEDGPYACHPNLDIPWDEVEHLVGTTVTHDMIRAAFAEATR